MEKDKIDGAGLIHQTIPECAETEPSLNIPLSAEALDWVEHAARLRSLGISEYVRRAIECYQILCDEQGVAELQAQVDRAESALVTERLRRDTLRRNAVVALARWRDQMPAEAVEAFQDALEMLR